MSDFIKSKLLIIVLTLVLLLPISVKADTAKLSVSCTPSKVMRGEQFSCTLSANTDFSVTKIELPFSLGTGLEAAQFVSADSERFTNTSISGGKVSADVATSTSGSFTIGILKINVSNNTSSGTKEITFNNGKFYNYFSQVVEAASINTSVVVPATLKSLTVNNNVATLGPTFSSSTYSYTLFLPNDTTSFGLTAVATNSSDTVKFIKDGTNEELNGASIAYNGEMKVNVVVGSGDAATTYAVLVSNEQGQSSGNPYLSSLTLSGQTVNLKNQSNADEEITVTLNTTNSYQLKAILSDSTNYDFSSEVLPSSCSVASGTLTCNLSGEVKIAIMVVPKNGGSGKNYILTIKQGSGSGGSGGGSSGGGGTSSDNPPVSTNPQTGGAAYVMAIVLILSLVATLYLYKRSISSFE